MERRAIIVRGIVQGVGYRPFVHSLAVRLRLNGYVKNRGGEVLIEVEGATETLDRFVSGLSLHPPPQARTDAISWSSREVVGDDSFRIVASDELASSPVLVAPDIATCEECLRELFDPRNRRFRYPFVNCCHCGPRLTIITGAPYDRGRTTMASFEVCAECRAEYDNPADRRFHAQPIACPACGPRLSVFDTSGRLNASGDPLADFARAIGDGRIGAMKGLGGYHLVCDAANPRAVSELRRRKHRDEKPFAVMVADASVARSYCQVSPLEQQLLESWQRPIVLLHQRRRGVSGGPALATDVAPGNPCLGVMLPYTPLHHLLLRELEGRPLVMTSGNRSDEPMTYQDDEVREKLSGIAEIYLTHDRAIRCPCDDSVTRMVEGAELPLRRSRSYAPQPMRLPIECALPVLAVGGQLKATFALGRNGLACLSHHLGDLDHFEAYRAFERAVSLYEQLFGVRPASIAHDLHPEYASTRYALQRAADEALDLVAVQHHHAHLASCMAEHELDGDVIGVTFDGTGYGADGAIWGGEFLVGGYSRFRRAGHLRYVRMPGGDRAVREPWRMAVSHLLDAGCDIHTLAPRVSPGALRTAETMIRQRLNAPLTSSAGRLFDAVSAIASCRQRVGYEGQAAMEWEWLAAEGLKDGHYPYALTDEKSADGVESCWIVDTRLLIRAVADDASQGVDVSRIARRFHTTLVEIIADVCRRIRDNAGLNRVVLSGGVFMNVLLTTDVTARLRGEQFEVYRHRIVPPNDGGLSLGQLAVAAARQNDLKGC